ncbi:MAG: CDP-diacylglycerol--serine O-phosphatidyltransferase [Terrimicrobiaceae bacterium]
MNPDNGEPKIYLLPNLMTAGNLFCGFAAVLTIIEAALVNQTGGSVVVLYHQAIAFILGACVFDLLDGRLARLGGHESPFGREFDSLADIVSFGTAPALLAYQIVLRDFSKTGWLIAFVYLLCGALRLARFNCVAQTNPKGGAGAEFVGFPIPAAAGLIASLTLFMLWMDEGAREIGPWKFALPPLLLFLSFMMFSHVRYPSFKGLGWGTQRSLPKFLGIIVLLALCAMHYEWMPALLFVIFLLYGFVRPFLSRTLRKEIEDEEEPGTQS